MLWANELSAAFQKINRPWPKGPELKQLFEEAGFVNVQMKELKRPTNDWPKDKHMKEIGKVRCGSSFVFQRDLLTPFHPVHILRDLRGSQSVLLLGFLAGKRMRCKCLWLRSERNSRRGRTMGTRKGKYILNEWPDTVH